MKRFYTLLLFMCSMFLCTTAQERKPLIEDYSVLVEEQGKTYLYHYVMAYTSDGWRSSENIYRSLKSGKTFLQEELYDVGKYTYEFDTQGRVKVKDVTYEKGNLQSYRIIADYSASPVSFTKYDGDLSKIASWTCHDNGALASYTFHVDDPETGGRAGTTVYYGENGELLSDATAYTLNEGTKIFTSDYEGDITIDYKYDGKFGRLLEFHTKGSNTAHFDGTQNASFEYDSFGRLTKLTTKYKEETTVATLEYFNDETYPIGNSWRDVFGYEGPLKKITIIAEDGSIERMLTFTRDDQGKILQMTENSDVYNIYNYEVKDGRIVSIKEVNKEDNSDYGETTITWNGEDITQVVYDDSYETETYTYTHSPGKMEEKYTVKQKSQFSGGGSEEYYSLEETGNTLIMNRGDMDGNVCYMKRIIQQEDMSVRRPDIGADLAGFCPERPILIGVKGRVLCSGYHQYEPWELVEVFSYNNSNLGAGLYFFNCNDDEFFNIRHEGATTTCADVLGRPVFETENGRLAREYIYNDESDESNSMPAPKRMQQKKAGETNGELKDVTVITYNYNAEGLCTGQTITAYDENGVAQQNDFTYTYTTGIKDVTTKSTPVSPRKLIKDGRVVIVRDGKSYNVTGIEVQP